MSPFKTSLVHPSRLALFALLCAGSAQAFDVRVTVENLAPAHGIFLTPVWVGFHNGTFDLYDPGAPASAALERLAEDGATSPISASFVGSGAGAADGTILGPTIPPIAPGESTSMMFSLDPHSPLARYFSYASMIIPSNDAFIANGNPLAHQVFDVTGNFLGASFMVLGNQVLDAGTEVNDELPANTAFFGQASPNTGVDQHGTVESHGGFKAPGSGGILDDARFTSANFLADGYRVARITVSAVPDTGATLPLITATLGGLLWLKPRRVES